MLAPGCLWCGARPAPHVVFGDPLCDECYDEHRAEGDDPRPAYLTDHDAAQSEVGALAYWLSVVVRLDDEVDDLTAGAMREEIRRIAEHVRGRESVRRAGQVLR